MVVEVVDGGTEVVAAGVFGDDADAAADDDGIGTVILTTSSSLMADTAP